MIDNISDDSKRSLQRIGSINIKLSFSCYRFDEDSSSSVGFLELCKALFLSRKTCHFCFIVVTTRLSLPNHGLQVTCLGDYSEALFCSRLSLANKGLIASETFTC